MPVYMCLWWRGTRRASPLRERRVAVISVVASLADVTFCRAATAPAPHRALPCIPAAYEMLQVPISELGLACFVLAVRSCGLGDDLDLFLLTVQGKLPCLSPPREAVLSAAHELYARMYPGRALSAEVAALAGKRLGMPAI